MYSGTTFRNKSGRLIGAHQKIDRVARRVLESLAPGSDFPSIKEILHFEGKNGPDGIKSKSPAQDEPWHYFDPSDSRHQKLFQIIERHSKNLQSALKKGEGEKAAFEAAWFAHALVDGLTPAHHYPLGEKLEELRGEGIETRTSTLDKLVVRGQDDRLTQMLVKNWEVWGARGIMTTHGLYEWGVATIAAPLRLHSARPTPADCRAVLKVGILELFIEAANGIYQLKMYERFQEKGWTRQLARETRDYLVPLIVKIVILGWYEALSKAQRSK